MLMRQVCLIFVLFGLLIPGLAGQPASPPTYRILVTSDEGVNAPGLAAVAQILQAIGSVVIVAPVQSQGLVSRGGADDEPILRDDLALPNGLRAIGLSATPAASVSVAIQRILPARPDLVVAGIHRGYILGDDVQRSGLVASAREAAMHGVPALAASLAAGGNSRDLVVAAEEVLGVARRVKQYGVAARTFLNVNVPSMPAGGYKGYAVTTLSPVGVPAYTDVTHPSGRRAYGRADRAGVPPIEGTDVWAVDHGYVSVTPLRLTETDLPQIEELRAVFR